MSDLRGRLKKAWRKAVQVDEMWQIVLPGLQHETTLESACTSRRSCVSTTAAWWPWASPSRHCTWSRRGRPSTPLPATAPTNAPPRWARAHRHSAKEPPAKHLSSFSCACSLLFAHCLFSSQYNVVLAQRAAYAPVLISWVTPVADAARHGHQGGLGGAPLAPGGQEHAPQAHQEWKGARTHCWGIHKINISDAKLKICNKKAHFGFWSVAEFKLNDTILIFHPTRHNVIFYLHNLFAHF